MTHIVILEHLGDCGAWWPRRRVQRDEHAVAGEHPVGGASNQLRVVAVGGVHEEGGVEVGRKTVVCA